MNDGLTAPAPTDDQRMIVETVGEWAAGSLGDDVAARIDREGMIPDDVLGELAEYGLLGIPITENKGGAGCDQLTLSLALIELAAASGSVALHVLIQSAVADLLARHDVAGDGLAGIVSGETPAGLMAFANVASVTVASTLDADQTNHATLSGRAPSVLGGATAKVLLVVTKSESGAPRLVLVDAEANGVARSESVERLGMRGVSVCDVTLDGAIGVVVARDMASLDAPHCASSRGRRSVGDRIDPSCARPCASLRRRTQTVRRRESVASKPCATRSPRWTKTMRWLSTWRRRRLGFSTRRRTPRISRD